MMIVESVKLGNTNLKAKADQLLPVPRHNVNKENESNEDTEPRHCRNILLAPSTPFLYEL